MQNNFKMAFFRMRTFTTKATYKPSMFMVPNNYDSTQDISKDSFNNAMRVNFPGNEKWKLSGRILDVGCAQGNLTVYMKEQFAKPGSKVSGCDLSENMIEYCQDKHKSSGIDFFALDITKQLESKELIENFDHVLLSNVFHWIPKTGTRSAIENSYKLLNKNGVLAAHFFKQLNMWSIWVHLSKHPEWGQYMKDYEQFMNPFQFLSKEETIDWFRGELKRAGFKDIYLNYSEKSRYCFSSIDVWKSILKALDPFYMRIPEDMRDQYLDYGLKISMDQGGVYSANTFLPDGEAPFVIPFEYVFARAVKA